ncbi:MAG: hypothetical protein RI556_06950 [Hydrogenovibrio sp.]|uniref:hypothetical protein n=1 Tax=Hydrogenovibrio sp. TaxID=2065821 RepID=UPI00287087C9|nr:hypothetical protein [Hydrogenovibrio sp.]MDR9498895.1 hypothetical protein [Hydrogenovibrio sp.]
MKVLASHREIGLAPAFFGLVLVLLVPGLLILENVKLFALALFIQLTALVLAFVDPAVGAMLYAALLVILSINSVRQSL